MKLERNRKQTESKKKPRPDEISSYRNNRPRYIPSEVRERVFNRAGFQCQYRGIGGTRCSSRTGLEIEHQRPFAIHHSHDERYLRVLCGRHNRFEAERVYGAELIQSKIEARRKLAR